MQEKNCCQFVRLNNMVRYFILVLFLAICNLSFATVSAQNIFLGDEKNNIEIYEKTNKAVVNITTRKVLIDEVFFLAVPQEGSGSGFVYDKQGHIITNYHVVENAENLVVTLYNGQQYSAS